MNDQDTIDDARRLLLVAVVHAIRESGELPGERLRLVPVLEAEFGTGAKGPDVARWQAVVGAKPDGAFGPETERLTAAWMAARGIEGEPRVTGDIWAAAFGIGLTFRGDRAWLERRGSPPIEVDPARAHAEALQLIC